MYNYDFRLSVFYQNKLLKTVSDDLKDFGLSGEVGLAGDIGTTTVTSSDELSDETLELIRKEFQELINKRINSGEENIKIIVEEGYLRK